ncbi:MAG: zinc-binding dehydrogenase, partial [Chloroflexi bacterium]|nr:zinc-binding dehydrogenase [Chloroflexota bacterium]
ARVPSGSSVVVIGVGGVGLNSIQGAALSGAYPIIAIDLVDSKLEAAKTFGATHTVNTSDNKASKIVYPLTEGRGADYVFVTVGSAAVIEEGRKLLRKGGTVVVVGMPPLGAKMEIEAVTLADKGQHIMGSKMGATRLQVDVPKLVALYENGRLKLDELITARYPLTEINEAIAAVKRGEALRNVIVF